MAHIPLGTLYRRGRHVLRHEGWRAFIRQGLSFVGTLFFACGDYHIYEKELHPGERIEPKPKIDCTEKVISSVDELDELAEQGYDFKAMNFRPKLERNATAFCLFAGQDLISVTWVASSEEAKKAIDYLPFKVNFGAGEVCSGASFTDTAQRSKGLFTHNRSCLYRYLATRGAARVVFSVEVGNVAAQRVNAKFNSAVTAKGRYTRILWWKAWKEQPMERLER